MAFASDAPHFRRFGLYALIVLALMLVSTVAFVILTDESLLGPDEVFNESVFLKPEHRPNFSFPVSVRTYDISLNRFVDRFARICLEGKYSEFRLMYTRRGDPTPPTRFESIFNAVKAIRILAIQRVPEMPNVPGPMYIMLAEYDLEDFANPGGDRTRRIQVAIAMEDGQWRIGPVPGPVLAKLRAAAAASQPTTAAADAGAVRPS